MKKPIQFRAWDKTNKRWIDLSESILPPPIPAELTAA
jgi:hypothetical protein